jgi:nucleoside phosphorylase
MVDRDIAFAYDAAQGRRELAANYFDLLILDLLLPADGMGDPELRHSIDLLSDLVSGGALHKPGRILGVTRDKQAFEEADPLFDDHLWHVIGVDDESEEWIDRVVNCVRYEKELSEQDNEGTKYKYDVAVIAALASPELEALHAIDWNWEAERPLDYSTMVRYGEMQTPKRSYSIVSASAPRMGMVSTAILATKVTTILRPRLLVMVGICAGVESKVNLGDVLFADPCWDYQSGKHAFDETRGSHFRISPHQLGPSEAVRARADIMRRDRDVWRSIEDNWPAPSPTSRLAMHIGPIASGSAVVADESVLPAILEQQRQLIGLEMEAYGLMAAAHAASPKPIAFVLKSVCDFASAKKDDRFQAYAAYTSANALRVFLEKYIDEIIDMTGE